jgi:hypothetical protein
MMMLMMDDDDDRRHADWVDDDYAGSIDDESERSRVVGDMTHVMEDVEDYMRLMRDGGSPQTVDTDVELEPYVDLSPSTDAIASHIHPAARAAFGWADIAYAAPNTVDIPMIADMLFGLRSLTIARSVVDVVAAVWQIYRLLTRHMPAEFVAFSSVMTAELTAVWQDEPEVGAPQELWTASSGGEFSERMWNALDVMRPTILSTLMAGLLGGRLESVYPEWVDYIKMLVGVKTLDPIQFALTLVESLHTLRCIATYLCDGDMKRLSEKIDPLTRIAAEVSILTGKLDDHSLVTDELVEDWQRLSNELAVQRLRYIRSPRERTVERVSELLSGFKSKLKEFGRQRVPPTGIYIYGKAEIGKSSLAIRIASYAVADRRKVKPTDVVKARYTPGPGYWDAIPTGVDVLCCDDLAALVDVKTSTEAVSSLLTLISGEPFEMPSAKMELKCRFMSPEMVIVTGNKTHLDDGRLFLTPSAVHRRLGLHIHMHEIGGATADRSNCVFDVSMWDRDAEKYVGVGRFDEVNLTKFIRREHKKKYTIAKTFRDASALLDMKCPKCVQPIAECECDVAYLDGFAGPPSKIPELIPRGTTVPGMIPSLFIQSASGPSTANVEFLPVRMTWSHARLLCPLALSIVSNLFWQVSWVYVVANSLVCMMVWPCDDVTPPINSFVGVKFWTERFIERVTWESTTTFIQGVNREIPFFVNTVVDHAVAQAQIRVRDELALRFPMLISTRAVLSRIRSRLLTLLNDPMMQALTVIATSWVVWKRLFPTWKEDSEFAKVTFVSAGLVSSTMAAMPAFEEVIHHLDEVSYELDGRPCALSAFPIGGSCYCTVAHFMRRGFVSNMVKFRLAKRSALVAASQSMVDYANDILAFTMQGAPTNNLLEAYVRTTSDVPDKGAAIIHYVGPDGRAILDTEYVTVGFSSYNDKMNGGMLHGMSFYKCDVISKVGACGSLLSVMCPDMRRRIIGYLVAVGPAVVVFRPITQEIILGVRPRVEHGLVANEVWNSAVAGALAERYVPVKQHNMSPWREHSAAMTHIPYILSVADHNQGKTNSYVRTPWADELGAFHGIDGSLYGLTDGRSGSVPGVDHKVSPFEHVILGTRQDDSQMFGLIGVDLDMPCRLMMDKIRSAGVVPYLRRPLTLSELLNGLPAPVLNRVDLTKSATFPAGKKRDHMFEVDGVWHLSVALEAAFYKALDALRDGTFVMMGKMSHKVNEVKLMEKILAGETRMVFGVHYVHFLILKMFLGPVLAYLAICDMWSGVSIGVSATGLSWDEMVRRMIAFSVHWLEIDFKKMDRTARRRILVAVFSMFVDVARHIGYSDSDIELLRAALAATLSPALSYKGDFFRWLFGFISGLFGTAQIVSYEAWYIFQLVLVVLAKCQEAQYRELSAMLATAFFGDDSNLSPEARLVERGLTAEFVVVTVSSFGYAISNGTDKNRPVEYAHFLKCGFLSRWFKPVQFPNGRVVYMGALREDSLFRMLLYSRRLGDGVDPDISADMLYNALREWWLHGREAYERFRPLYAKWLAMLERERPNPEYDDFMPAFFCGDFRTWTGGGEAWDPVLLLDGRMLGVRGEDAEDGVLPDTPEKESGSAATATPLGVSACAGGRDAHCVDLRSLSRMATVSLVRPCLWRSHIVGCTPTERGWQIVNTALVILLSCALWLLILQTTENSGKSSLNDVAPLVPGPTPVEPTPACLPCAEITGGGGFVVVNSGEGEMVIGEAPSQQLSDMRAPNERLEDIFNRPVLIGSLTMSGVVPGAVTGLFPLDTWAESVLVNSRLAYYKNWRGTFCIRIEAAASPHFYGELGAALLPFCPTRPQVAEWPSWMATDVCGVFNINTCAPLVLKYPYFFYKDHVIINNSAERQTYVLLAAQTISPIMRDDSVGVVVPNINVYAWVEDIELTEMSYLVTAVGEGGGVPMTAVRGGIERRVSMLQDYARGIAGNVSTMFRLVLTAGRQADQLAVTLGPLAALFGFSAPTVMPTQAGMQMSVGSVANVDVPQLTQKLSLFSGQGLPLTNGFDGVASQDPLTFAYHTRRWGVCGQFTYATNLAAGAILAGMPVTPYIFNNCANGPYYAPCTIPAMGLGAWTGSMEYRLSIPATPFHKGKILIAYFPANGGQSIPSMSTAQVTSKCMVVDVSQSTDIGFTIGWASDYPFEGVLNGSLNAPLAGTICTLSPNPTTVSNVAGTNGYIVIWVFDVLTATATGANLTCTLWARCGRDVEFALPTTQVVCEYNSAVGPGGGVSFSAAGSDVDSGQFTAKQLSLTCEPYNVWLSGGLSLGGKAAKVFGEEVVSLRALFKRYTPWFTGISGAGTVPSISTPNEVSMLPILQYPIASITAAGRTPSGGNVNPNHIGLVLRCFAGMRGSMRHRFYIPNSAYLDQSTGSTSFLCADWPTTPAC